MGPPAGKDCSPVFMSECCGWVPSTDASTAIPLPGLEDHFHNVAASNCSGLSRDKQRQLVRDEEKKERAAVKQEALSASEQASQADTVHSQQAYPKMHQANMLLEIEFRKEQRFVRDQEIARLLWLVKRSESKNDTAATDKWNLELDLLYEIPLSTPSHSHSLSSQQLSTPSKSQSMTPVSTDSSASSKQSCGFLFSPPSKFFARDAVEPGLSSLSNFVPHETEPVSSHIEDQNLQFTASDETEDSLQLISSVLPINSTPTSILPMIEPPTSILLIIETPTSILPIIEPPISTPPPASVQPPTPTSILPIIPTPTRVASPRTRRLLHQKSFIKHVRNFFRIQQISRDGHCLFACFSTFFNRHGLTLLPDSIPFTPLIVRNLCADELIRLKGKIPGMV